MVSPYGMFRHGYDGHAAVYRVHGIIAAPRPPDLLTAFGVEDWATDDDDDDSDPGDQEAAGEGDEADDETPPPSKRTVA